MSKPHKCPICDGSGIYSTATTGASLPTRASDPCHGCNGTGILWEFTLEPTPFEPPWPGWPEPYPQSTTAPEPRWIPYPQTTDVPWSNT